MKIPQEHIDALKGHPEAAAIMAVLQSPTEPGDMQDRKQGHSVSMAADGVPDVDTGEMLEHQLFDVVLLKHWRGGFDPLEYKVHLERQATRARWHDLGFLLRPNRKGPSAKVTPSVRRKVLKAYKDQVSPSPSVSV